MKIAALGLVALFAFARDCGGGDAPAGGGGGGAVEVWDQVYATWSCTADARPSITFTIEKISPTAVEQRWSSDGATGVASVHMDALYLENFKNIAYDDYGYTEQPKGTLAALDEFGSAAGNAPYHCVKK